jgi:hypothetical protein
VTCLLGLVSCSERREPGLANRLGPRKLGRRQINREVREVLPALALQELSFEFDEGCRLKIGFANEASPRALTFELTWLRHGDPLPGPGKPGIAPGGRGLEERAHWGGRW